MLIEYAIFGCVMLESFIDVQPWKDMLICYEAKPRQSHVTTMAEKKVIIHKHFF